VNKLLIITILSGFFLYSCGKSNQVNTTSGGQFNDVLAPSTAPITTQNLAQIFASRPCSQGVRISEAKFTSSQISFAGDTLMGNFQPGYVSGTEYDRYIGISSFSDILIIEKVSNGNQVVGYNAIVSLCEYGELVKRGMQFNSIQFLNGITLTDNLNCNYGSVLSSSSVMYPSNSIHGLQVETVFTVPTTSSCPF
jgi:hypothetical protein